MIVPSLPATLAPPAPFPLVVAQSVESEAVAPGVRRGTYRLQTSDGPLVVHVVAVDTHEPTVRLGVVVARDRMISGGETLSSMARRTGAVAGVNADYFDIGNTNQPLNLVVRDGTLLRSPSKRAVFAVRSDRSVRFESVAFAGTVRYGATTLPLTAINEWPPQGGATLLDANYGTVSSAVGVVLAQLVPAGATPANATPPATPGGARGGLASTYRVVSVGPSQTHAIVGPELGFGPAALARAAPPVAGDLVALDAALAPDDALAQAVGGGPLLVVDGAPVDDPNAPAPEERDRRFPVSGAALLRDGTLLFASVDGRRPALSIGLTRPQFAALALGFGATDAMAFDSGGSAELVTRALGDERATVFGSPSDGEERAIADGAFVYSDAPPGPPAQLVVRPAHVVALPGVVVPLRAALVDAGGHALGPAHLADGDAVRAGAASSVVTVRSGALRSDVAIDVVSTLARIDVAADTGDPDPGALVHVTATGIDARGRGVVLGDAVAYTVDGGSFVAPDTLRVGERDANVVAEAAGIRGTLVVRVGSHDVAFDAFGPARRDAWRFASAPASAPSVPSALAFGDGPPAELRLGFDFSHDARAAYATARDLVLPGEPAAFALDIDGDGSGVGVRATFRNRLGETRALTLAKSVSWTGWQRRSIAIPRDLDAPVALTALYIVDSLGPARTHAVGTLAFRDLVVRVLGRPAASSDRGDGRRAQNAARR